MTTPAEDRVILVVDDDAQIREAMRDTLELEGFSVVEAGDGGAALEALRSGPAPMLILLDWNMAPMNALDFMREIEATPMQATIPVVLITADGRAASKATLAQFAAYLMKPVTVKLLLETISKLTTR